MKALILLFSFLFTVNVFADIPNTKVYTLVNQTQVSVNYFAVNSLEPWEFDIGKSDIDKALMNIVSEGFTLKDSSLASIDVNISSWDMQSGPVFFSSNNHSELYAYYSAGVDKIERELLNKFELVKKGVTYSSGNWPRVWEIIVVAKHIDAILASFEQKGVAIDSLNLQVEVSSIKMQGGDAFIGNNGAIVVYRSVSETDLIEVLHEKIFK